MSGEALKLEIRGAAVERSTRLLDEARAKAAAILAEAEREARNITERKVEDAKKRIEQLEKSEMARLRMERNKKMLTLQEQYASAAFQEAETKIYNIPSSDPKRYRKILKQFVIEAFEKLGQDRAVAIVRDSDQFLLEDIMKELNNGNGRSINCSISTDSLESSGGIVLHSENARVYFVNTLESRFLNSKERVAAKVEALLKAKE